MRTSTITTLFLTLLLAPSLAGADQHDPYFSRIVHKLARGVTNVAMSPFEIPVTAYRDMRRSHNANEGLDAGTMNLMAGAAEGLGMMFVRAGVGVFEIITFPVPTEPFIQPEAPENPLEVVVNERLDDRMTRFGKTRPHCLNNACSFKCKITPHSCADFQYNYAP